ncbi:preprotein translocase subunit SecE [Sphingomonas xanthus]|uniref:Protein translocase subunit SecE n=1 Tax=Sphingomonas xanthus TaxID=2594473 RepID=A0A516IPZ0_9SPHN|nr:preprotein translocase subunit SecE [Sphingomonas xanthus]
MRSNRPARNAGLTSRDLLPTRGALIALHDRGPAGCPRTSFFYLLEDIDIVAKVNPGEFIRQVRAEGSKVVWPTMKETRTTAIMVLIMTTILAIFFFGVDSAFSAIVQWLLGLLG